MSKYNLEGKSFEELKTLAYFIVVEGQACSFSKKWQETKANMIPKSELGKLFKKLLTIYRAGITKKYTQDEVEQKLKLEETIYKYLKSPGKMLDIVMETVNSAFQEQGIEFGKVKLECPICDGELIAVKEFTPQFVHKVSFSGSCEKCGLNYRN